MLNPNYKSILKISLPVTLVQFTASLLIVIDTIVVKFFQPEALATLGGGNGIYLFIQLVSVSALFSLDGFVAQASRLNELDSHKQVLRTSIFFALCVSLILVLAAIVLTLLWHGGESHDISIYILTMSLSLPFYLVFLVIQKYWTARGASSNMFYINLLGLAVNAVADVAFIFLLSTEPESAFPIAMATVCLRVTLLIIVLRYSQVKLGSRTALNFFLPIPSRQLLSKIIPLSLSSSSAGALDSATFLLLGLGAIYYGPTAMEVNQYAITIGMVLFPLYFGVANAATVLVGGAVGQGEISQAREHATRSLKLASVFAFAISLLLLGAIFTGYFNAYTNMVWVLICISLYQWADAIQAVSAGILRASNIGFPQLIANALAFYLFGPLILIICLELDLEFLGLWVTFSSAIIATGIIHYLYYLKWSRCWLLNEV